MPVNMLPEPSNPYRGFRTEPKREPLVCDLGFRRRSCFVCGSHGPCKHREIAAELAEMDARCRNR